MNTVQSYCLHPFRKTWYLRSIWRSYGLNGLRPAYTNIENKLFLLWYQCLLWLLPVSCPTSRQLLTFFWMSVGFELLLVDSLLTGIFFFFFCPRSCHVAQVDLSPGWPYLLYIDWDAEMVCLDSVHLLQVKFSKCLLGAKEPADILAEEHSVYVRGGGGLGRAEE